MEEEKGREGKEKEGKGSREGKGVMEEKEGRLSRRRPPNKNSKYATGCVYLDKVCLSSCLSLLLSSVFVMNKRV